MYVWMVCVVLFLPGGLQIVVQCHTDHTTKSPKITFYRRYDSCICSHSALCCSLETYYHAADKGETVLILKTTVHRSVEMVGTSR